MSHPAFLRGIGGEPDDDTPRLVYADWLDEHGEADRAEFIRVQCELARWVPDLGRRGSLKARASELLAAHRQEWLGGLTAFCRAWSFERGLPRVTLTVRRAASRRFA